MKLVSSNLWRGYGISRVLRTALYSAEAQQPSSSPPKEDLYKRLSHFGNPKVSVVPVLDQWIQEGRDFKQPELLRIIKQLRLFHRHSHALQIQEYMNDKLNIKPTNGGMAIQLDLISKVHGLDKAEEYFNSIPASLRLDKVHSAMLLCYAMSKSFEKADELFQKMKDLGFVKSVVTYNVMLGLFSRTGNSEKLNSLIQEMEEKGIEGDGYTFCILLNVYATSNVEEMEKLLTKIEAESPSVIDFHVYLVAAKGYLRAGLAEKSLAVIKKAEKLIKKTKGTKSHYEHLLTLYGAAGQKGKVYYIWGLYKKRKVNNSGYLSVMSALVKLDDIDGAERIFYEWLSGPTGFDKRIADLLISTYCKKRLMEKAFDCAERLMDKGHNLSAGTWQCLANFCCVEGQMAMAVETLKKALSVGEKKWRLNRGTLAGCLDYLKMEGDTETSLEILKSVMENGNLSVSVCDRLIDFVTSDKEFGASAVMDDDDFEGKADLVADENANV